MSYTYKLKGARWLRKYTAETTSPVYAAAVSAQAITDSMCDVKWERAQSDGPATFPSHQAVEDALTRNVANRDLFDAAAFCAGHKDGQHRVYANAACYVFALPDEAVGATLSKVTAHVTSDPYNELGVRLAVHLMDEPEIPMDCAEVRSGVAHADGAMPRTSEEVDGRTYWNVADGDVEIALETPAALKRYLMLVVALENYSRARGDWIEGAAYIRNSVEIELAEAVAGWDAYDLHDCRNESIPPFHVLDGALPRATATYAAAFAATRLANGDLTSYDDGDEAVRAAAAANAVTAAGSVAGLHAVYGDLVDGRLAAVPARALPKGARPGFGFSAWRGPVSVRVGEQGRAGGEKAQAWQVATSALVVPLFSPGARYTSVSLAWAPVQTAARGRAWILRGQRLEELKDDLLAAPDFYTAAHASHAGFDLMGEFALSAGTAAFSLDMPLPSVATLLLTAYLAPDAIDLDGPFPQGLGSLMVHADGTVSGFDTLLVPEIALV